MIYLIGMGPGSVENLTLEAVDILKNSSSVISFGRIGETAEALGLEVQKVSRIAEVKEILKRNQLDKDETQKISILASGDPCFYGILEYLKREQIDISRVIPGVSSIQYMMSKLQISWHNANLVSFHGREEEREEKIKSIVDSSLSIMLTDKKNTPDSISKLLKVRKMNGTVYAGFDLSYKEEEIIKVDIGEEIVDKSSLAVVVIESKGRL